ncbi:MAE_28990/MAE_18760 family HEPN-like nuclease [Pandoraea sputorum]|uniref:MAE_28990/MAE_18760 family HEPN-like nuclease n=1 Tax=Pandoraea sputorum TaxID=93222 RepID=UPI002AF6BE74|nr:MAE_28990/MAE_18760 family HEPN-like nuclease [Pandoraea sputorum]
MARHLPLTSAKQETRSARNRHKAMLDNIRLHSITNNVEKQDFLFLMAVPVIYAAWEGYFRIACSICLRRQCHIGQKARKYGAKYSTLWLQKESFFDSFLQNLFNAMQLGRAQKKLNAGKFTALSEFSHKLAGWLEQPINHLSNFDDLVMTYSNVNRDVVLLNCGVIGINVDNVDFSKLNELLNRRNDIAHGGIVDYPREATVNELLDYTAGLIDSFHASVETWLVGS